jgi:hypothetical protein
VIGSVAMRVGNVFRDTLISAAQVNSLLSDATEQSLAADAAIACFSSNFFPSV